MSNEVRQRLEERRIHQMPVKSVTSISAREHQLRVVRGLPASAARGGKEQDSEAEEAEAGVPFDASAFIVSLTNKKSKARTQVESAPSIALKLDSANGGGGGGSGGGCDGDVIMSASSLRFPTYAAVSGMGTAAKLGLTLDLKKVTAATEARSDYNELVRNILSAPLGAHMSTHTPPADTAAAAAAAAAAASAAVFFERPSTPRTILARMPSIPPPRPADLAPSEDALADPPAAFPESYATHAPPQYPERRGAGREVAGKEAGVGHDVAVHEELETVEADRLKVIVGVPGRKAPVSGADPRAGLAGAEAKRNDEPVYYVAIGGQHAAPAVSPPQPQRHRDSATLSGMSARGAVPMPPMPPLPTVTHGFVPKLVNKAQLRLRTGGLRTAAMY